MATTTKFQVEHQDGSLLGAHCDTLVEAVLVAAGHDGFHSCFLRMDDDGNIAPSNPMRLFGGSRHIGNNPYHPTPKDSFGFESILAGDEAAQADVANQVYLHGVYHSRYKLDIVELSYTDDVLTHVRGTPVEELAAQDPDSSVEELRRYWGSA